VVVEVEGVDEVVGVELVDEDVDVELVVEAVTVVEVELVGVGVWSADVPGAVSPSPEHAAITPTASTVTASKHALRTTTAGP
jgi:hypothetical protein